MIPPELEINDYYGYNSIINCEGKRIRRMRRTEASAEKLYCQRVKSPLLSRSTSSKRSRVSQNKNSNCSDSINHHDSTFKFCKQKISNANIQKQSQSFHSVSNFSQKSKKMSNLQSSQIDRPFRDIKQVMGDYYIENEAKLVQKYAKQLLKTHKSSQKSNMLNQEKSSRLQSNIGCLTVNGQSRRTLKKTQKSNLIVKPFQLQQNKVKEQQNQLEFIDESSLLKKRQSNIQLKKSKSNAKLTKISKNLNESRVSSSMLSNNEDRLKRSIKNNRVNFEDNVESLKQSHQIKDDYGITDHYSNKLLSEKGSILKKSSINIELPSEISSYSQDSSRLSSYASKLRSKLKSNRQKSKLSKVKQFVSEEEARSPANKGKTAMMTKKSTQTTQSNKSHQNSCQGQPRPNAFNDQHANSSKKIGDLKENSEKKYSQLNCSTSSIKSQLRQKIDMKNNRYNMNFSSTKHGEPHQLLKINKKKSIGDYTFNDVVQNIEEHEIRICSIYLFVDSTKALYETPLQFERYERLCFLMLKKYWFEKYRIIDSIQGGASCFTLLDAEIPSEVLQKHLNRQEVRERLAAFVQEGKKLSGQLEDFFNRISKKYQKDKYIKVEAVRDNFSPEIMRLLMEELTKLYQELQKEDIENEVIDANEQRIIEIVQIMFLISELNGKFVKKFQLFEQNDIDFEQYYSQNYERIMETAEYFQKYA